MSHLSTGPALRFAVHVDASAPNVERGCEAAEVGRSGACAPRGKKGCKVCTADCAVLIEVRDREITGRNRGV